MLVARLEEDLEVKLMRADRTTRFGGTPVGGGGVGAGAGSKGNCYKACMFPVCYYDK